MRTSFERDLVIHAGLGAICALQPQLILLWVGYIILVEGTIKVFHSQNIYGQAHLAAGYMAALEMIVRMARIGLPHELTKYAVILILINGLLARPRYQPGSGIYVLYFLLLLPSIVFLADQGSLERARQLVSFNLSGPLCLAVAAIYFFRRPIDLKELARIFQRILLPFAALLAWLFLRTPNLSEISFGYSANFAASGYGPNQMAAMLGAGIMIIGIALLFRIPVFRWRLVAFVMLGALAFRGLLTFSRGGMAVPLVILSGIIVFFMVNDRQFRRQFGHIFLITGLVVGFGYGLFTYVNQVTGSALYNRYAGISYGQKVGVEKYTSGRLEILRIDTDIFMDNPLLGIGPGAGTDLRPEYGYHERVAAHVEFSRLLAEHGLLGLISLGILLLGPIKEFFCRRGLHQRFLLIAGVLFCLGFMAHSATRIALPMFLYGLGFALVYNSALSLPSASIVTRRKIFSPTTAL